LTATIELNYLPARIDIEVQDNGVGIFKKIQQAFNLPDPHDVILELAKGKLTTDPQHHTGEGIFFTSRMFDTFSIYSGSLLFMHTETGDDWLLEDVDAQKGTCVLMQISPMSEQTSQQVFDKYTSDDGDYGFTKTNIPVALARYGDESLVSRSQAKRLLARFERFREIILDFKGVSSIGQAFADEVFRVFPKDHPHVHLYPIETNRQVMKMINRAKSHDFEQPNSDAGFAS
jgi:hypothetical protein